MRGNPILHTLRNRHRVIAVGASLALCTAFALAVAFGPQANAADPALYVDSNNGRVERLFTHPDDDTCSAVVAVDLHRGYSSPSAATASHVSGVGRITRQGTAIRSQVDNIRVGARDGNPVVNDLFASASSSVRDNTPAGGSVPGGPGTTNLNDEADFSGDLDPPYEPIANPLNSDSDFPGNVNPLRAYSDWLPQAGPEVLRVRAFFTLRCRSGELARFTLLSDPTLNDA